MRLICPMKINYPFSIHICMYQHFYHVIHRSSSGVPDIIVCYVFQVSFQVMLSTLRTRFCGCRVILRKYSDQTAFPWERSKLPELLVSASSQFQSKEYAIIDDVLDIDDARCIREEIKRLKASSRLEPNCTFIWDPTTQKTVLFPKSQILEYDYLSESKVKGAAETGQHTPLVDSLSKDTLFCRMLNAIWGRQVLVSNSDDLNINGDENILVKQDLKLQCNKGNGGAFPIHFDSDPSVDTRFLTCILYLNDQDDIDGGELVLYPHNADIVKIKPLLNRMVMFKSQSMAHRVLPSFSERYCLTLWCSTLPHSLHQGDVNNARYLLERYQAASNNEERQDIKKDILSLPHIRRHFLKYLHRDGWRRSIQESHDNTVENSKLLELFDLEIQTIENALGPMLR